MDKKYQDKLTLHNLYINDLITEIFTQTLYKKTVSIRLVYQNLKGIL